MEDDKKHTIAIRPEDESCPIAADNAIVLTEEEQMNATTAESFNRTEDAAESTSLRRDAETSVSCKGTVAKKDVVCNTECIAPPVDCRDNKPQPVALVVKVPKNREARAFLPTNCIQQPNAYDVLLGRGKPFQNHHGNQEMLRLVDMYRAQYHESERAWKHEIIENVLKMIQGNGGRFLERIDDFENSCWNEVSRTVAYRKVGHAFRSNARILSMKKRNSIPSDPRRVHPTECMPMGRPPPVVRPPFYGGLPPMGFNYSSMNGVGPLGMPLGIPGGRPMFGMMSGPPGILCNPGWHPHHAGKSGQQQEQHQRVNGELIMTQQRPQAILAGDGTDPLPYSFHETNDKATSLSENDTKINMNENHVIFLEDADSNDDYHGHHRAYADPLPAFEQQQHHQRMKNESSAGNNTRPESVGIM